MNEKTKILINNLKEEHVTIEERTKKQYSQGQKDFLEFHRKLRSFWEKGILTDKQINKIINIR